MKLTVKNFENFLQSISSKKKFDIFFLKIRKKQIFATKKKGAQWGKSQQFFQGNPT